MKRGTRTYKAITIILWTLAALSFGICMVFGANMPNQSKYKSFIERSKQVPESEIEPARSSELGRKASENKRPWLSDSFLDMENMVDPDFGGRGETPQYQLPDGTRSDNRAFPMLAGCALSAPPVIDVADGDLKYNVHIGILHGIIKEVKIRGPAAIGGSAGLAQASKNIPVSVYPNAADGTPIFVSVKTVSVRKKPEGKFEGQCLAKTIVLNEECKCDGGTPTIQASDTTIAPGGSITVTVNSGGLACPPYTWTVAGTGYSIAPATTENDLETAQLTSAAGACGVGYGAYATVTVTDSCGVTDTAYIRNSAGDWVEIGVYVDLPDGFPCMTPPPGCDGGADEYYEDNIKRWVVGSDACFEAAGGHSGVWVVSSGSPVVPPCGSPQSCATQCCGGGCVSYAVVSSYYEWGCP